MDAGSLSVLSHCHGPDESCWIVWVTAFLLCLSGINHLLCVFNLTAAERSLIAGIFG